MHTVCASHRCLIAAADRSQQSRACSAADRASGQDATDRPLSSLFDFDWNWDRDLALLGGANAPALDVMEEDDRFVIRCDVPGVEKKDVDVAVSGNTLTIKGEKNDTREEK